MIVLGIETSCDETGVGIVRDGEIVANQLASSIAEHRPFGGIIPEIAARAHAESIDQVLKAAMAEAKIDWSDLDAVAVAGGPGLVPCLAVGAQSAKSLAETLAIPVFALNHLIAHCVIATYRNPLESPLADVTEIHYPLIALIVSGGHCALYLVNSFTDSITLLGTTVDDAPGDCFDKVGRAFGLDYPAGPLIDQIAQTGNPQAIVFPQAFTESQYLHQHRWDFSFSGIKTAVVRYQGPEPLADVLASFSLAVTEVLAAKTVSAAESCAVSQIVVGGGFSANSMLRKTLAERAQSADLQVFFPKMQYCTDQGAMVAKLGFELFASGTPASALDFTVDSVLKLDQIML
jgi:N6-L-threonylcarbamoyladenine synthase